MPRSTTKRTATKKKAAAGSPARAEAAAATAPTPTYQTKSAIPADPTVRILFHGLLNFFFEGKTACHVGVHNTTHGLFPPHRHPHNFNVRIRVIDGNGTSTPLPLPPVINNPKLTQGVDIKVSGAQELDGVYVYQKGDFNRPPNDVSGNDEKDWRWVVDVESDLLYPEGVTNKTDAINPSVRIDNGLFYTVYATTQRFVLRPAGGGDDRPVGRVAEYVGANIYLTPTGRVDLTVRPLQPISLPAGHGVTYQIDIRNDCRQGGSDCVFTPNGPAKEERNDFYMYYDTFDKPAGKPEYELCCEGCSSGQATPVDIDALLRDEGFFSDESDEREKFLSNNEAPCGPTGHGQSGTPTAP